MTSQKMILLGAVPVDKIYVNIANDYFLELYPNLRWS